jgi:hypothetical protein
MCRFRIPCKKVEDDYTEITLTKVHYLNNAVPIFVLPGHAHSMGATAQAVWKLVRRAAARDSRVSF